PTPAQPVSEEEGELPEEVIKTPPGTSAVPTTSMRQPVPAHADDDEMPIDKTMMSLEVPDIAATPKESEKGAGGVSIPDGSLLVGKPVGNYRLMKFIGQNPIAAVYEAWDTRRNRAIALKLLHQPLSAQEPMRKRFLEEARAASNLDHPNIVKVYSY